MRKMKIAEIRATYALRELGIPPNLEGYHYLRYGILLTIEKHGKIKLMSELYPSIAEKYSTTPSRVERSIRNAVSIAFERGDKELLGEYFKLSNGRPTCGKFISALAKEVEPKHFDDV